MMLILQRPLTLRDGLTLKYNVISVYRNILAHADSPYFFDQVHKKWWRYFCEIYGFYYSRVHRSYTIWLSNGMKKNIGLYMPFLMRMPGKKTNPANTWKNRSFLYKNSMGSWLKNHWSNPRYFKKINLLKFDPYWSTKATLYSNFTGHSEHYAHGPEGPLGFDEEATFSGYNAKWHNIYKYWASFYQLSGFSPSRFLVAVNSLSLWSGFFINLFDTTVILYPEHYLTYYNNLYRHKWDSLFSPYISNLFYYFFFNFDNLYKKLLQFFFFLLVKFFFSKLKNFFSLNFFDNDLLSYKIYLFYFFYLYFKNYRLNFYPQDSRVSWNLFLFWGEKKNLLETFFLKGFKKKSFSHDFYSSDDLDNSSKNLLVSNLWKKNFFLNKKNLFNLNMFKIYRPRGRVLSKKFINIWKFFFTSNFYKKNGQKNLWFKFCQNQKNIFWPRKFLNFSYLSPNSSFFLNKYPIKIKRILTYGKLFLRIPLKTFKHNLRITKASTFIASKGSFRTFIFPFYKKNILNKIVKFNYNFFFILNASIRLNYGFSFTLMKYKKDFSYYRNLDHYFFSNMQYFIYKYMKFFQIYLKKRLKITNLFGKKRFFFYQIFYHSINQYKLMKSRKIFSFLSKRKLKYFDFCYRGINFVKRI